MFRSVWCKLGANLKRSTATINGECSSISFSAPTARYFPFTCQNPNVVISNSRVTSIFHSFSTAISNDIEFHTSADSDSFGVSYLINSCGLSETEAITASEKLNFKCKFKADKVLTLLRTYGFTESHISKTINKVPWILQYKRPSEFLTPKLDFFISKGLPGTDLASVISSFPGLLGRGLVKEIIPSFDLLKSVVESDENVITMIKNNAWIINIRQVKRVVVNVEHLRKEGVSEASIQKYLIRVPRAYTAEKFEEIVKKVKQMGFHHSETTFLKAVHILTIMSEAKRWVSVV